MHALMTLTAISPLLATSTFEKAVVVAHNALPLGWLAWGVREKCDVSNWLCLFDSPVPNQELVREAGLALWVIASRCELREHWGCRTYKSDFL